MENKAVIIDLKNISISFDDQPILKDVSLEIHDGEFVTLLGPSGCGKTTTLRIIAGFLSPDSGDVIFEGKKINGVPAHKRQVNTIFQRYALFPNLNVADNIAFGLKLRKDMQSELKAIQQRLGITFIYVTHDQEEALSMSDTIVVMDGGVIQQIGSPTDIYNEPQNAFVADFIGESNIVDGVMLSDYNVEFQGMRCRCVDKGFGLNEPVDVVVRPEDIDMVPPGDGMLSGDVTSVTFKGVHYEIIVDIKGFKWMIQTTEKAEVGDRIGISIKPDEIQIMKKSEYSGLYGDYSSFSEEFDELSDPNAELTDEDEVSEIGE